MTRPRSDSAGIGAYVRSSNPIRTLYFVGALVTLAGGACALVPAGVLIPAGVLAPAVWAVGLLAAGAGLLVLTATCFCHAIVWQIVNRDT